MILHMLRGYDTINKNKKNSMNLQKESIMDKGVLNLKVESQRTKFRAYKENKEPSHENGRRRWNRQLREKF